MNISVSRLRADLQSRTGIDFADYVDDELVDSITGWTGLLGVVREIALALGSGTAVVIVAVVVAVATDLDVEATTGLVIGGTIAGLGTAALTLALRLRLRIPREASRVFDVAGAAADRVASDVAAGRLTITAGDAARGVTLVAAIPALTRAARRRFPLLGWIAAPTFGAVLSRALLRVWPTGEGSVPLAGLEAPARRLEDTLRKVSGAVLPRITTAVRWSTLPLAVGGASMITLAVALVLISWSVD